MKYKAIVENDTLKVVYVYLDNGTRNFGGPWGDVSVTTHVEVPDGMNTDVLGAVRDADGVISIVISPERVAEIKANKWSTVRSQRNSLLTACDWTQLPDSPLTDSEKAAWSSYRQALRNLPETYKDSEPDDVVFPTAPK